jgi:hypothetical protein
MRTDTWVSPQNFHFIGFNFGAHMLAYSARKLLIPAVKRLTALDPGAALGFTSMVFARYFFNPVYWTDAE